MKFPYLLFWLAQIVPLYKLRTQAEQAYCPQDYKLINDKSICMDLQSHGHEQRSFLAKIGDAYPDCNIDIIICHSIVVYLKLPGNTLAVSSDNHVICEKDTFWEWLI